MSLTPQHLSLLIGLIFGSLNLWLLSRIIRGLIQSEQTRKWKTGAYFFLKITLLFVIIGLILKNGYATPLPFLAGFTLSLVVGITILLLKKSHSKEG